MKSVAQIFSGLRVVGVEICVTEFYSFQASLFKDGKQQNDHRNHGLHMGSL